MAAGMVDRPSMLPGSAQFYYGDDLHAVVAGSRSGAASSWRYSEADIQVLGFVLESAVGMNLSAYLAEKLWKPLGMEAPAFCALDRPRGTGQTFCFVSS